MKYHNEQQVRYGVSVVRSFTTNPVALVTAQNAAEQKERFIKKALPYVMAGKKIPASANPTFVYNEELLKRTASYVDKIQKAISFILDNCICENAQDEAILKILKARLEDIYFTAKIAQSILDKTDQNTAKYNSEKYDCPSGRLFAEAYEGIKNKQSGGTKNSILSEDAIKKLKGVELTADKIAYVFCQGISYLEHDPNQWKISIDEKTTAIDVRYQDHTVYIPKSKKANGLKTLSLLFHEIWSHLLSSANGEIFFKTILKGTPLYSLAALLANSNNETLYEGIAKMSDVRIGGEGELPKYTATVAIDQARMGKSFVETARELFKYQDIKIKQPENDSEEAKQKASEDAYRKALSAVWGQTYRVYRGATYVAKNPGKYVFPKDAAYLNGYRKALRLKPEKNPVYSQYSSMRIKDIKLLDSVFPEFKTIPKQYDLQDMLNKATEWILAA